MRRKITKVLSNSQENLSETVTNVHDKEIAKEKYISSEEMLKIICGLRLISWYKNGISKTDKFVRQYTKSNN